VTDVWFNKFGRAFMKYGKGELYFMLKIIMIVILHCTKLFSLFFLSKLISFCQINLD